MHSHRTRVKNGALQVAALRKQIVLLQDDIRQLAGEEERLLRVNSQLKQRLEDTMETNNRNVEAAESELQVFSRVPVVACAACRARQDWRGSAAHHPRACMPTVHAYDMRTVLIETLV